MMMVAAISAFLALSFLVFDGVSMISPSDPARTPGWDERASVNDWPSDYLNGTVTPIGWIHSDIGTYEGDDVTVQGNVTAAPGEYDIGHFFIQDSTGGLMVNATGSSFYFGLSRGDFVRLNGTVGQTVQGMHTVEDARSYWVMSTGNVVEAEHMYNSSLVSSSDQGMLVKMNGYLTNFRYYNTSHSDPDWERSVCTSTLWMYNRTFAVNATNITLSDYGGFAMVTGVVFCGDGTYVLSPRSASDVEQGSGPYRTPNIDGDVSDWHSSETAVDDSDSDCSYVGNEIRCTYVTWDADSLHLAVDYTITTGYAMIVYIDAIPGYGATNVSSISSPGWVWSRHLDFMDDFTADAMLCRYEDEVPQVWRIASNAVAVDVTMMVAGIGSGFADGNGAVVEVAIPWYTLYGQDPGEVLPGSTIRMVTVLTGGENTNAYDSSPDNVLDSRWNGWSHVLLYYDFCVDFDLDSYPDDYSSGFAIPEFSTLFVVPTMLAVVVLVSRAKRRKT